MVLEISVDAIQNCIVSQKPKILLHTFTITLIYIFGKQRKY